MFTGIIEEKGKVIRIEVLGQTKRLAIEILSNLTEIQLGGSININGVCLTVAEQKGQIIKVDLSMETLQRTTLAELREDDAVNLERALKLSDRLGGHIVTGHIDGIGVIVDKRREKDFYHLRIKMPPLTSRYVVQKGSVAIDGISLTVNECQREEIQVTLIPFTLKKTTLIDKKIGDRVNVEVDILGKYVEKLLNSGNKKKEGIDLSFLKEHGFIERG